MELWWIGTNGSIQSAFWYENAPWKRYELVRWCVDFENGNVRIWILTYQYGWVGQPVEKTDGDFFGSINDVMIGQNHAPIVQHRTTSRAFSHGELMERFHRR